MGDSIGDTILFASLANLSIAGVLRYTTGNRHSIG